MKLKLPSTYNVLMFLTLLACAWEYWTIVSPTRGDTFSATIRKLGTEQPFIILFTGMVTGHLFWPLLDKEDTPSP